MNIAIVLLVAAALMSACKTAQSPAPPASPASVASPASPASVASAVIAEKDATPDTTADGTSTAPDLASYQHALAHRISQVNSLKVYAGRPQALLRSVIVVKYVIDANGNLLRSEIVRTNRIKINEATALATLKSTAPFPKPAPALLKNGRLELLETWLFNNDGRFQLRTIAEPQMDQ